MNILSSKRRAVQAGLLVLPFFASACAAHAGSGAVPIVPLAQNESVAAPASTVTTTASIVIRVPLAAATTKSVSVAVNGGTPSVVNTNAGASGCSAATTSAPLTCTVHISAPAASDVFTVKTYSAAAGTGTLLASASILQSVPSTGTTISVALAGSVASLAVALAQSSATECAAAITTPVYVRAQDSAGNILVTSNYGVTIALHDTDASGATHISATSITASSVPVSLSYNGNKVGPSVSITASASGVTTSTAAVLKLNQQLYVWDANNQYIQVFGTGSTGNVAPSRILNERGRMTSQARAIAISRTCQLYAADGGNNTVFVFPAGGNGSVAPTATIAGASTLLNGPQGVATDSTGKIYVPIYNSTTRLGGVGIWNAGANGNVAPATTIMGSNTQIAHPAFMGFDKAGNLYVLDFRKVVVFAKGATGNVAPLRVLLTPNLYCISGMTVDPSGQIYVTDCSNTVNVYAASATSSAAPIRVINTGTNSGPAGAVVDYSNNVFTSLQRIPSVVSYASSATGAATTRTNIKGAATTLYLPFNVAL